MDCPNSFLVKIRIGSRRKSSALLLSNAAKAALFEGIFRAIVLWSCVNIKRLKWSNFAIRALTPLTG
jgi:hypothetical protein